MITHQARRIARRLRRFARRLRRLARRSVPVSASTDLPLSAVVRASKWQPSHAEWEMIADLEHELIKRPQAKIAVLVGDRASALGGMVESAFPHVTLCRADLREDPSTLHTVLAAGGPFDLIIDDSRRVGIRKRVFRNSWYHLSPGGLYLIRDVRQKPWPAHRRPVDSALWPLVLDLLGRRGDEPPDKRDCRSEDDWHRVEALGSVKIGAGHLIMENRTEAQAKVRDEEMNKIIELRRDGRAAVIKQLPAVAFTARGHVQPARLLADTDRYKINFEPPPMTVRQYRDAIVTPHQVATQGNLILPETYRHHLYPRLRNRATQEVSHYFATAKQNETPTLLPGRYFHLDAEWREHYGHLLTEQLSRLWAWRELKQQMPDLKALLSLQRGRDRPRQWELDIFAAAGIEPDDLVVLKGPTQVETLIGATPMLSMPSYIDSRITELWDSVGDRLASQASSEPSGSPVFISRPPDSKTRPYHNQSEVEQYFGDRGFEVVRPELLSVGEQVRLFRRASMLAGFAGSGMFTMMFRRDAVPVILLRPSSYTAVNEYLISAVRGHSLHVIDSAPDHDHGEGWSWKAFYSGSTFDFEAEGRILDRTLDRLGLQATPPTTGSAQREFATAANQH